jgi:hypothetical protein
MGQPATVRIRHSPTRRPAGRRDSARELRFGLAVAHLVIAGNAALIGILSMTDAAQRIGGPPMGLAAWVGVVGLVEAVVGEVRFKTLPMAMLAALFAVALGPRLLLSMLSLAAITHAVVFMVIIGRILRRRESHPRH